MMEKENKEEYIYDSENGQYVWYNSFKEAFNHMNLSEIVDDEERLKR